MTSLQSTNADGSVVEVPYSGQVIFAKDKRAFMQAINAESDCEIPRPYTRSTAMRHYGPVEVNEGNRTFAITVSRRSCAI